LSPSRHWEPDESGQPTQQIIEARRRAQFIAPIPKPKKRKRAATQQVFEKMGSVKETGVDSEGELTKK
jgi:hypothetical protein